MPMSWSIIWPAYVGHQGRKSSRCYQSLQLLLNYCLHFCILFGNYQERNNPKLKKKMLSFEWSLKAFKDFFTCKKQSEQLLHCLTPLQPHSIFLPLFVHVKGTVFPKFWYERSIRIYIKSQQIWKVALDFKHI